MGFNKCILPYTCHYDIIQNSCTASKIPCVPFTHPFTPPRKFLPTTDLFTISIVLLFFRISYSWNHIVCSLFSRLLSFNNRYLRFFHVFFWVYSSFPFICLIFHSMDVPQFVYPFTIEDHLVASKFWLLVINCYQHLCTIVCVCMYA